MDASFLIDKLNLKPHPEGGWYKETFLSEIIINNRPVSSMIYFLLKADEQSNWHRVTDADEIWIWNSGSILDLEFKIGNKTKNIFLGNQFEKGQNIQAVIPKGCWQRAKPISNTWCLVTCIVTPAFSFKGFELADKNLFN